MQTYYLHIVGKIAKNVFSLSEEVGLDFTIKENCYTATVLKWMA